MWTIHAFNDIFFLKILFVSIGRSKSRRIQSFNKEQSLRRKNFSWKGDEFMFSLNNEKSKHHDENDCEFFLKQDQFQSLMQSLVF